MAKKPSKGTGTSKVHFIMLEAEMPDLWSFRANSGEQALSAEVRLIDDTTDSSVHRHNREWRERWTGLLLRRVQSQR